MSGERGGEGEFMLPSMDEKYSSRSFSFSCVAKYESSSKKYRRGVPKKSK